MSASAAKLKPEPPPLAMAPPFALPPEVLHPPRIASYAQASSYASGDDAIALSESAGLILDPWQQFVLRCSLGEVRRDGMAKWASQKMGLCAARQNGKTALLAARELAGLYLFNERLITHSAHLFETSQQSFQFTAALIEGTPSLRRKLKRNRNHGIDISKGQEGIYLQSGQALRFKARSTRSGRGLSGDLIVLDEAMYLNAGMMAALVPTLTTAPNPQLWYVGTAVDQLIHPDGQTFAGVRHRGIFDLDGRLTYIEWSCEPPAARMPGMPVRPEDVNIYDESLWPIANPGMPDRVTYDYIRAFDLEELSRRGFAVERLGIGDWPAVNAGAGVVAPEVWLSLIDESLPVADPVVFTADVGMGGRWSSITMSARSRDGQLTLTEVTDDGPGTGWVAARLQELHRKWEPLAIVIDGAARNAPIAEALLDLGVPFERTSATDMARATSGWLAAVGEGTYRHRGDPILQDAVTDSTTRELAGGVALAAKDTGGSISALNSAVIGRYWLLLQTGGLPPAGVPLGIPNRDHQSVSEADLLSVGF